MNETAEQSEVETEELEAAEPALDPERQARLDAARAQIRVWGDPILKSRAVPVDRFDEELRDTAARMVGIMDDAFGIGLAATQIGELRRIFVYRPPIITDDENDERQLGDAVALVNPEIVERSKSTEEYEEGCLSLPGVHVDVDRPEQVTVRAQDLNGQPVELEAEGIEARVIQHELDHLDGVLMIDRCSRQQRREAVRTLNDRG